MNNLQIFENEEFGEIRTVTIDDEPWFVGKDVATALGYKNTKDALAAHVEDCDKIMGSQNATPSIKDSMGREQYPTWINESGLYALIFGSKLESAKRFKHWVTKEVLPAIRKTGSYQRPMTPEEMMRVQLGMLDKIGDRVSKLENTMNIDYGQQRVLEREVAKVVLMRSEGKTVMHITRSGRKYSLNAITT